MIDLVRTALGDERAWLVGGTLRDRLLGRETLDIDVVVEGDVRNAARKLGRAAGGASFELSDQYGAWRVVARDRSWQVDVVPLQGGSLEADLAARDLTVNAMAEPVGGGDLIDPHGGAADLGARRLRMVSSAAFDADPLRALRVARLATELGFSVEANTAAAAAQRAPLLPAVAPERVFAELKRVVGSRDPLRGLALMDELSLTAYVLPEFDALRGVGQSRYHHRDVHGHTLEVLQHVVDLERDPGIVFGADLGPRVEALLAEPLADELTRGGALRLGALLHDAAKPQTRTDFGEGRVGFPGHDSAGADLARDVLGRLRASERLRAHVAALTRHHLRLGFLVRDMPLDRRAEYRYLEACAPVAADVTLLSVADRLATRGRKADVAIERHVGLARQLLVAALDRRDAGSVAPLVRGDELAAEVGIEPGPQLGVLLAEIAEARYAGEIASRAEAISLARAALSAR